MDILLIAFGFAALLLGGEMLVGGAVALARRLGVPPLVIGLTLVGFGTSTPELVTSIEAALVGAPGIAVGNVVGSNIANILLILGLAALLMPVAVERMAFRRDGAVVLAATLALVAVALGGTLGRTVGAAFLATLAVYVVGTILSERRSRSAAAPIYEAEADAAPLPALGTGIGTARALVALVAGIAITVLGAKALVAGAVGVAAAFGVPEAVIGLTVVAVGTSMPELVTSAIAARRGQSDVALGNVLGSNVFNILGILGATALVQPLEIPPSILAFDLWAMLAATLLLLGVAVTGWRIDRREGAAMLALYAVYLGWLAAGL